MQIIDINLPTGFGVRLRQGDIEAKDSNIDAGNCTVFISVVSIIISIIIKIIIKRCN